MLEQEAGASVVIADRAPRELVADVVQVHHDSGVEMASGQLLSKGTARCLLDR